MGEGIYLDDKQIAYAYRKAAEFIRHQSSYSTDTAKDAAETLEWWADNIDPQEPQEIGSVVVDRDGDRWVRVADDAAPWHYGVQRASWAELLQKYGPLTAW